MDEFRNFLVDLITGIDENLSIRHDEILADRRDVLCQVLNKFDDCEAEMIAETSADMKEMLNPHIQKLSYLSSFCDLCQVEGCDLGDDDEVASAICSKCPIGKIKGAIYKQMSVALWPKYLVYLREGSAKYTKYTKNLSFPMPFTEWADMMIEPYR